ncbi:hypothetical protein P7C70_g4542, partial [Phenoliferia sp. Uapishka_3]
MDSSLPYPFCSRLPLALDPFVSNVSEPSPFISSRNPPFTALPALKIPPFRPSGLVAPTPDSVGLSSSSIPAPSSSRNALAFNYGTRGVSPARRNPNLPPTPTSTPPVYVRGGHEVGYTGGMSSLDAEMLDAFATPTTNRLPPGSTLRLGATPPTPSTYPRSATAPGGGAATHLAPINTSNLLFAAAPLTPPLTPPYGANSSKPLGRAPPTLQVPAQVAPSPSQAPTLSARALEGHRLHPLFESTYCIEEELGCGGFGFVVRATVRETGESVAVKFIERTKIPQDNWVLSRSFKPASGVGYTGNERQRLLPLEAYVLGAIRNIKGVVRYIDLYEDNIYFYLIMELHGSPWSSDKDTAPAPPMPQFGPDLVATPVSSPMLSPLELSPPRPVAMARRSSCDLFECIEQHNRFDEKTARFVFRQIVNVVYELGKHGIFHRDIKDENIVVSDDYEVKLIDFGSAVIYNTNAPVAPTFRRFYGTTSFASPEILRGDEYEAPPCEVWSLGILLSILITGEVPFHDPEAAKVGRLSNPRVTFPDEAHELMRSCLTVDLHNRITIDEIRRHRWLNPTF